VDYCIAAAAAIVASPYRCSIALRMIAVAQHLQEARSPRSAGDPRLCPQGALATSLSAACVAAEASLSVAWCAQAAELTSLFSSMILLVR
jgi:hypothetical protein